MNKLNEEKKQKKYLEVKAIVESEGYRLLSKEWNGFREYYEVECPKGHSYRVQWANFHRGNRCVKCNHEALSQINPKYKGKSRDEFRDEMDKQFKEQLSSEGYRYDDAQKYKNNLGKFQVICPENHEWEVSWNAWSIGRRCKKCFEIRMRKDTEEIRKELALENCELVGEYNGSSKTFAYICSCGGRGRTTIRNFREGTRCARCRGDRNRESLRLSRLKKLEEYEELNTGNGNRETEV